MTLDSAMDARMPIPALHLRSARAPRRRPVAAFALGLALLAPPSAVLAADASLTIDQGVVVKFGDDAGLVVRDRLATGTGVVLTSRDDGSIGGSTGDGTPSPGDWRGVRVEPSTTPGNLQLAGLRIRYAGAGEAAGLDLAQADYVLSNLEISDSIRGLRIANGGRTRLDGARIAGNVVGIEVLGGATPTITNSSFEGNLEFAILNFTPLQVVQALGNWWGAPSGPREPASNPGGEGDLVSAGVNFAGYVAEAPLSGCSLDVADGVWRVATPSVTLRLTCAGATSVRLSESPSFAGASPQPMAPTVVFTLAPTVGPHLVHAEFQGASGRRVTAVLAQPVQLDPAAPRVRFDAPADGAEPGVGPVVLRATAFDAGAGAEVVFSVDGAVVGRDASAPYQASWNADAAGGGVHVLRAEVTSIYGQRASDERVVALLRPGPDGTVYGAPYYHTVPGGATTPYPDVASALDGMWAAYLALGNPPTCSYSVRPLDPVGNAGGLALVDFDGGCSGGAVLTATASTFSLAIDTPAADAVLTADTAVTVSAQAPAAIASVRFLVGNTEFARDTAAPWAATLRVDQVPEGAQPLRVIARTITGVEREVSIPVRIVPTPPDAEPPVLADARLGAATLVDGLPVGAPALVSVDASDASGIASVRAVVAGVPVAMSRASASRWQVFLDWRGLADGPLPIRLEATDGAGNTATLTATVALALAPPPAPVIQTPLAGQALADPRVLVTGSAAPGSRIRLFLNDAEVVMPEAGASSAGSFGASISLPAEGPQRLSAEAYNDRGASPRSAEVAFSFALPAPSIAFQQPVEGGVFNQAVEAEVPVELLASDAAGLARVEVFAGERLVDTLTAAPWSFRLPIADAPDGELALRAVAWNTRGRSSEATRTIRLARVDVAPPVRTPYTGRVDAVTPALSYGEQPIEIAGAAVARDDDTLVPAAQLALVLEVGGFQRRILVTTDADGLFRYTFRPQASDAGRYRVGARHPDEAEVAFGGEFTINRLAVSPAHVALSAAYGVPTTLDVQLSASAGSGVRGVILEARAEDQPSGALPPGLQVLSSDRVDVAAGGHATAGVVFLAAEGSAASGTVILTARALESGSRERGRVRVDYQLSAARPSLLPRPAYVDTGVRRGQSVTEAVRIENRGVADARGLRLRLLGQDGQGTAPDWIRISSPAAIDRIAVGDATTVEVSAAPPPGTPDGIYRARLEVAADNWGPQSLPVAIAVTDAEDGSLAFHVANIYTDTLDEDGQPIPGLAGARITLENEEVVTQRFSVTTGADGRARLDGLPAGRYVYRASARNHVDEGGRVQVRAGAVTEQEVFLDYAAVTLEWSVTETTIEDRYDVVLEAVFQAQVPAPVVLMQPLSINLPDMQVGEELTGELTITNYGLVRADNVSFTLPASDAYYRIEFMGEVPPVLAARERITLPYRITAIGPLPGMAAPADPSREPLRWAAQRALSAAASCWHYRNGPSLRYDYACANGTRREGSAMSAFNKAYGSACSVRGTPVSIGGGGGGGAGGWGGAGGYGPGMALGPECIPECEDGPCPKPGGTAGGGE